MPVSAVSLRRHRERQPRLDDRHVGHERVVDQRHLAPADREHGGGRDLGAGARPWWAPPPAARVWSISRVVRPRACARRGTAASARRATAPGSRGRGAWPSRRRCTEPPPTAIDEVGRAARRAPRRRRGSAPRAARARSPRRRARRRRRDGGAPRRRPRAPRRRASVTSSAWRGAQLAQAVERAGVEVGVGRHAEPLRRRLAAGDRLDVQQVAVVDVVGGDRAAPGAAAERERRRHRVVDAAERADRGRRVDEDAPGPDRARRSRRSTVLVAWRRRPRCGRARRARSPARRRAMRVLDGRRAHQARAPASASPGAAGGAASSSRSDGQRREQHLVVARRPRSRPSRPRFDARLAEGAQLDARRPARTRSSRERARPRPRSSSRAPIRSNSATISS